MCDLGLFLQLLGLALLGAGIFILTAPETNLDNLDAGNLLTAPAIILCVIGGSLFLLGFCGCFGALLELYYPLIVVSVPSSRWVYMYLHCGECALILVGTVYPLLW